MVTAWSDELDDALGGTVEPDRVLHADLLASTLQGDKLAKALC